MMWLVAVLIIQLGVNVGITQSIHTSDEWVSTTTSPNVTTELPDDVEYGQEAILNYLGIACPAGHRCVAVLECLPCDYGFFKQDESSDLCSQCPAGCTTLRKGATSWRECVAKCPYGYEESYDGKTCVKCPSGSYKDTWDNALCTPCPNADYDQSMVGLTSLNDCYASWTTSSPTTGGNTSPTSHSSSPESTSTDASTSSTPSTTSGDTSPIWHSTSPQSSSTESPTFSTTTHSATTRHTSPTWHSTSPHSSSSESSTTSTTHSGNMGHTSSTSSHTSSQFTTSNTDSTTTALPTSSFPTTTPSIQYEESTIIGCWISISLNANTYADFSEWEALTMDNLQDIRFGLAFEWMFYLFADNSIADVTLLNFTFYDVGNLQINAKFVAQFDMYTTVLPRYLTEQCQAEINSGGQYYSTVSQDVTVNPDYIYYGYHYEHTNELNNDGCPLWGCSGVQYYAETECNSERFCQCEYNDWVVMPCAGGTYFDNSVGVCNHIGMVNCPEVWAK